MTTIATVEELTVLDHAGINNYATLIAHYYTDDTPLQEHADEVYRLVVAAMANPEMRALARCMGATLLERAVWGSRRNGQDDPPVSGFVGKAVDEVIDELTPLVEAREPGFFRFIEAEDWTG